ncbi:HdeD family acid-resistance protein [Ramlibacter solisilvae]|uniref:Membrane protein n=1 Tax=Ramlibacter tataouinensis TaxID=94132 RepID=A0A127JSD9_9BURK|nr:HdeD family acid-resistance protein [Ramlibacter tataouinensis]AMO22813.1 membrane protein [Ramlibacter tataouinensis]
MNADIGTPPWMLILRGVIALVFGVLAVIWPGLTLLWLVALFAAYAIFGGAVSAAAAFQVRRTEQRWWIPLLLGIVSVVAGVYAFMYPGLTALVLIIVMGVNAVFTGALDIAQAMRLERGRGLLILTGVLSLVFGVLVIWAPGAGALALVWLVGFYAIATGALMLALGLRLRRQRDLRPMPSGGP